MTNREKVLKALKEEYLRNILFFEHEAPKLAEILKNNLKSDTGMFQSNDHDGVVNILERSFFNLKNSYEAYSRLANEPVTSCARIVYTNQPQTGGRVEYINSVDDESKPVLLNESKN